MDPRFETETGLTGGPIDKGQGVASTGGRGGRTPALPVIPYESTYVGEAQIVTADGTILARRSLEEGPGTIIADLSLSETAVALDEPADRFWIPEMPWWMVAAWSYQNAHDKREYRRNKRREAFGWSGWRCGEDSGHQRGIAMVV